MIENFRAAMSANGIITNESLIPDGELHRFHVEGDNPHIKDGFYALHHYNGFYAGMFGWWKQNGGEQINWCSKKQEELTSDERKIINDEIERSKRLREEEKIKRHQEARIESLNIWNQSKPASNDHPYLVRKKIKNHNLRLTDNNRLVIPLYGSDKQIHTLQFICDDGQKRFLTGGKKSDNYYPIGKPKEKLYIAEGYATAATIYEITSCAVACAFDCGNLLSIAKLMRQKFPNIEIVIAGDNDQWPTKTGDVNNSGLNKAREAAHEINASVVYPDFKDFDVSTKPTDWNDLFLIAGVEETKRQLNQMQTEDWPEPEPIQNELLPVNVLPPEIIPNPFHDFITDVAERMNCPIDFVAIALLEVVSTVIGAGCGIRPKKIDDWLVIPNCWGCIVGRPGVMKSPAVNEVMRFVENLESEAKKTQDENIKSYNTEFALFTAKKDAIKSQMVQSHKKIIKNGIKADQVVNPEHLKDLLDELKEPTKPVWKRFKTNDPTVEKLHELSAENPRGILVYRDELMGWLRNLDKTGHESARAFYLEGWSGEASLTTDRIGRGSTRAENLCLSVFGTTQPDKLISYLYEAVHGSNDGLIQRFQLMVYPDEHPKWQGIDRKPNHDAKLRVAKIIRTLADMDFINHGAKQAPNDRFPYFKFSEEAQSLYDEWLKDLETVKLKNRDAHPIIIEHLSKYRSLMPSLALLFQLIDIADGKAYNAITKDNALRAAAWVDYLESHARRIYAMATDIDMKAASLLSEKILQGKLENGFTVRDVYRKDWSLLKNKIIAQSACNELVEAGWLREVVTTAAYRQKGKVTFLINPQIVRIKS